MAIRSIWETAVRPGDTVSEAGRTVSTDAIMDRLWGDDVPATAQGTGFGLYLRPAQAPRPHRSTREGPSILVSRSGGLCPADS